MFTKPEILLRIEGAFDLARGLIFFQAIHSNWLLFILLLLVPDLASLGYLRGIRLGTVCYNLVHTLMGPFLIIAYEMLRIVLESVLPPSRKATARQAVLDGLG